MLRIFILISLFYNVRLLAQRCPLQVGDVVFQETGGEQAYFIKVATKSNWTHTGVVIKENGVLKVIEAVGPVKISSLRNFLYGGKKKVYAVRRFKERKMVTINKELLTQELKKYLGKPYDFLFRWEDKKIYCSELVWKGYKKVGIELAPIQRIRDLNITKEIIAFAKKRFRKNGETFDLKKWKQERVAPPSLVYRSKHMINVADSDNLLARDLVELCK